MLASLCLRSRLKIKQIIVWNHKIPAPGGPIKIIRIPAVAFCLRDEPPPVVCSSLDSNCSTRVSSLRTKSRRASTEASSIGAIASCEDYQKAGPRQKEGSVGAKPYGQRLVKMLVLVGKRYMWTSPRSGAAGVTFPRIPMLSVVTPVLRTTSETELAVCPAYPYGVRAWRRKGQVMCRISKIFTPSPFRISAKWRNLRCESLYQIYLNILLKNSDTLP